MRTKTSSAAAALLLLSTLTSAQEEPCAQLTSSLTGNTTTPTLALACLRSIPLQTSSVTTQLAGLRFFLQFQSDLAYLNSSQPARLYPDTDLLGGIADLENRVENGEFENEYDFQVEVAKLFASAYDGHTAYIPDIVGTFAFLRVDSEGGGSRFPLISVSTDGIEIPEIYAYRDRAALAEDGDRGYEASPVEQIDGQDVTEYLNELAAMGGSMHDPDANWNLLFPNELAARNGTIFEQFLFFDGVERNETVLTFANGTERRLEIVAAPTIDLQGVNNADDFFERCCSGTIGPLLEQAIGGDGAPMSLAPRHLEKMKKRHGIDVLLNFEDSRPALRHHKRQEAPGSDGLFPEPVTTSDTDVGVVGYFPDSAPDLAVLAINSFLVGFDISEMDPEAGGSAIIDGVSAFQSTISSFLDAALEANKTRLTVDLRGNGGGLGFLAHDTFRTLFPTATPYDAGNFRNHDVFDFTGQVVTAGFEGVNPAAIQDPLVAQLYAGALPFNAAQQLDASNSSFESWEALAGPADVPSIDRYTELVRPNLTSALTTIFPVFPQGRSPAELSRAQVFSPENIVLLQDGGCASACALFTEFMKTNAPGDGTVRQVVVGGRPQSGPAQGVGGVKGGQLGLFTAVGFAALFAAQTAPLVGVDGGVGQTDVVNAISALDRASPASPGSINLRNTIREDDSSVTPLQYVYDAADYRIFYTAAMYTSQEMLWRKAYEVAWEDGEAVADSTGHPSAQFGTAYGDVEIPDNARSEASVSMGGGNGGSDNGGNGANGGANPSEGDSEEDESAATRMSMSAVLLALCLSLAALMM